MARGVLPVLLSVALALPALLRAGPASAAEGDRVSEVEALAAQAKQYYLAGDYGGAVAAYLRAYRTAPAAGLLYNVAIIYDKKLGERDLAVDFYRRYIAAPDADPSVVERATLRVQELKAEKAAVEAATLAPPPPPPVEAPPQQVTQPVRTGDPGRGQRLAGWVTLGAGVAAAGVGVVFGVQAQSSQDDFEAGTTLTEKHDARDQGEQQALIADVLYGVGAAAAITGLVLVLTAPDGEAVSGLRVAPTPDGAALGWGGVF